MTAPACAICGGSGRPRRPLILLIEDTEYHTLPGTQLVRAGDHVCQLHTSVAARAEQYRGIPNPRLPLLK